MPRPGSAEAAYRPRVGGTARPTGRVGERLYGPQGTPVEAPDIGPGSPPSYRACSGSIYAFRGTFRPVSGRSGGSAEMRSTP